MLFLSSWNALRRDCEESSFPSPRKEVGKNSPSGCSPLGRERGCLDEAAPSGLAAHRGNADVHPFSAGGIDDAHVTVRIARLARFHGIEIPQLYVEGAGVALNSSISSSRQSQNPLPARSKSSCPYPADIVSEAIKRFIQIA